MSQWNILRGEKGSRFIANWNGDPSPVVHQLDRYMYVSEPAWIRQSHHIQGSFSKSLFQPQVIPRAVCVISQSYACDTMVCQSTRSG
jgi:hypothetical protein